MTFLFNANQTLLMDGAMATMLQKRGLPLGMASDGWSLEKPDEVSRVHQSYIDAGSQMIVTNTFGASRERLKAEGLENRVAEINHRSAQLALATAKAAPHKVWVAGSIGPICPMGQSFNQFSFDEATTIYMQQVQALIAAGVDVLFFETMTNLAEIKTVLGLNHNHASFLSMTVTKTQKLPSGEDPLDIVKLDGFDRLSAVGFNCCEGPRSIAPVLEKLKQKTNKALLIKPNWDPDCKLNFKDEMQKLFDPQVRLIGGCCGTTPHHIQELASPLDLN